MSKIRSSVIEPATGTTLTLGASGDTVAVSSDAIKLNTLKDSGGNTLFTSNGSGTLSSVNSGLSGAGPKLLQSQTADGSSTVSFTSGIDSTYDKYMFVFINISPSAEAHFSFQGSTNGGSSYGLTITSTFFRAAHNEAGTWTGLDYMADFDLAQSTSIQALANSIEDDADGSASGTLYLFNPSSTTYVKQRYSNMQMMQYGTSPLSQETFVAGYINDTSAVDAIQFSLNTGTFDGIIKLYGVS